MKCSVVFCSGMGIAGGYFLTTITYGSIQMSNNCGPAGIAQKNYENATNAHQNAINVYDASMRDVQNANTKIQDAQCIESSLPTFVSQADQYCVYDTLDKYNIAVAVEPNTGPVRSKSRMWDRITQVEYDCMFGKDYINYLCSDNCITWSCTRFCDPEDLYCYKYEKSGNSEICVDTRTSYVQRSCWYDRITDTFNHYGIIAKGNSGISVQCGQYTHEISINAVDKISSDTTITVLMQAGKIVQEKRDIYHTSTLNFISKTPNINSATKQVPPSANSVQLLGNELLQFIQHQCNLASLNVKPAEFYAQIRNLTLSKLPQLNENLEQSLKIMQAAKETADGKKVLFDEAATICNQSLATWLPAILVPSFLLCCCLIASKQRNLEDESENSCNFDTDKSDCGLGNTCLYKPLLFGRSAGPTVTQQNNANQENSQNYDIQTESQRKPSMAVTYV